MNIQSRHGVIQVNEQQQQSNSIQQKKLQTTKQTKKKETCKTTNKQLNPNWTHLCGIVEIKIHTTVVEYYNKGTKTLVDRKRQEHRKLGQKNGESNCLLA